MRVEVRGPDLRGLEGRSRGARLRARLELQVPREPGMLALAHGFFVAPPAAADRAVLPLPSVAHLLHKLLLTIFPESIPFQQSSFNFGFVFFSVSQH